MNPGGDFGKRELSPALRSRFTEIWVPQISKREDFELVLQLVLRPELSSRLIIPMLDYVEWFNSEVCGVENSQFTDFKLSLRDVLGWARFVVTCTRELVEDVGKVYQSFLHGAALMHLDGLGLGTGLSSQGSSGARSKVRECVERKTKRCEFHGDSLRSFLTPFARRRPRPASSKRCPRPTSRSQRLASPTTSRPRRQSRATCPHPLASGSYPSRFPPAPCRFPRACSSP